jgi:hypothetical protein
LSFWLSAVAMAAFLRPHFGRSAALLGGACYILLPYRLLDLYTRAAMPESSAFLWPPLLFLAIDRSGTTARSQVDAADSRATARAGRVRDFFRALGVALAMAGLVFTHHGLAALFAPLAVAFAFTRLSAARALRASALVVLGAGLAAPSLLPAILERAHVLWFAPRFEFSFLYGDASTLFPGYADRVDQNSLFYVAAAVFAVAGAARARCASSWLFAAAVLLPFFLATRWSRWLWEWVPLLQGLDMPVRWLAVATFSICFVVAAAWRAGGGLRVAAFVLFVLGTAMGVRDWVLPARYAPHLAHRSEPTYVDLQAFRPRWVGPGPLPDGAVPHLLAHGRVLGSAASCHRALFDVRAERDAVLYTNMFYYPSWQARAGDAPARVWAQHGMMQVRVPKGRHRIELRFESSPARDTALSLALASVAAALALSWPLRRRG